MAYYGGYSRGYAKAQEEYRKKEYETELEKAKEIYQAQTGLPWTEAEEQEFAHLWRLKLIKAPKSFTSLSLKDRLIVLLLYSLFVIFCISGLIGLIINKSAASVKHSVLLFLIGSALTIAFLYDLTQSYHALQTIKHIGEDAWREQVAKRQEENDIEPWNAEGHYY